MNKNIDLSSFFHTMALTQHNTAKNPEIITIEPSWMSRNILKFKSYLVQT